MSDLTFSEILIGRAWIAAIATFWSLGVACAGVPVVLKHSIKYALPGIAMVALLSAIEPGAPLVVLALVAATGLIVLPTLWLVGIMDEENRRPAGWVLGATLVAFSGSLLLPLGLVPAMVIVLLLGPLFLLAVPISLVVIAQKQLRSVPWLPGIASALSFALGWVAWASLNHHNR